MIVKCISSGSHGNCYLFIDNNKNTLIVEAGVKARIIKQEINFDLSKIVGCIATHEHSDHFKACIDLMSMGINVYATKETHQQKNTEKHHRAKFIHVLSTFELGPFKIKAFPIEHDAANPVGFIIYHKECGRTLFLTDSFYVKYRFKKINNFLIEVNYSDEIINENIQKGSTNMFLRNRVLKSHMNLTNAIKLLKANDLKLVKNILLIHLSNTNASTDLFENEIRKATGKPTKVMLDNQTYDISINSF